MAVTALSRTTGGKTRHGLGSDSGYSGSEVYYSTL
jgi:hypothetical protein